MIQLKNVCFQKIFSPHFNSPHPELNRSYDYETAKS